MSGTGTISRISRGSGSLTLLNPTSGTIDGNNKDFVFTTQPTIVVVDGAAYLLNNGFTWNSGTNTASLTVAPTFDVFGL